MRKIYKLSKIAGSKIDAGEAACIRDSRVDHEDIPVTMRSAKCTEAQELHTRIRFFCTEHRVILKGQMLLDRSVDRMHKARQAVVAQNDRCNTRHDNCAQNMD